MSDTLEKVSIPVEVAMQSEIKTGYISCPAFARLLDLFNGETDGNAEFFYLASSPEPKAEAFRTFLRKSAVDYIAVADINLARGLGSNQSWKAYPFVPKYPIHVSLQLKNHNVIGTFHLSEMQTVQELLNEKPRFIPITEATISSNGKLIGTRPFVILNKEHILISREKTALPASKYNFAVSQG